MNKKMKLGELKVQSFVTNLNKDTAETAKGGAPVLSFPCTVTTIIVATRGDCDMPTIGHNDGSWCISKDPDAWCGGR
ncbi:MAG: pinensin family lanthipeptide [Cyclobacteriaceae bacterium]